MIYIFLSVLCLVSGYLGYVYINFLYFKDKKKFEREDKRLTEEKYNKLPRKVRRKTILKAVRGL